jgi:hypothetical protein
MVEELPVQCQVKRAMLARKNAIATENTAFANVEDLWLARLTLWVVTPAAVQGTTLEKYRGPNTRAVVKRKTHEVEDKT